MKLKDRASFFPFCHVKPMYEVWLIWIKGHVGEKRSTVITHCCCKTRSPNITKVVICVNQTVEISWYQFQRIFGRIRVICLQNKIYKYICIYEMRWSWWWFPSFLDQQRRVLAHWNNNPRVYMSLLSNPLSLFRDNLSLLLLFNYVFFAEKRQSLIL